MSLNLIKAIAGSFLLAVIAALYGFVVYHYWPFPYSFTMGAATFAVSLLSWQSVWWDYWLEMEDRKFQTEKDANVQA